MSSKIPWSSLLCAVTAIIAVESTACAEGWWKGLFNKHRPSFASRNEQELEKATTLVVGEFTGATGTTAAKAITDQLATSDSVQVLGKGARFILSGKSVGGRVTGKLEDRKGKVIFERTYAAPGIEDNVRALADDVIFAVTGRPGQAASRIAFVSDVTGTKQVYVCDADGSHVEQVTRQSHAAVSPAVAPDGSMMAYTGYASGFPNVILIDMGAGQDRQLANTPGMNTSAAFSPDGHRLALTMSFVGNPEIFVLDLNNNHAVCVTESIGVPSSPAWHPDGKRLIFSSNEGMGPQLYTVDTSAELPAVRWPTGYSFATDPEWSPKGDEVAFTTRLGSDLAVVVKRYPTGSSRIIQGSGAQHPTWSPDGRSLGYVHNGQLWVHDLTTGKRRSIVSGRGDISEPRWTR